MLLCVPLLWVDEPSLQYLLLMLINFFLGGGGGGGFQQYLDSTMRVSMLLRVHADYYVDVTDF